MKYQEIEGDLIKLALEGKFDVIAHGCNCQCVMGAGLAPQMAKVFGCDKFLLEKEEYKGNINKLGQIQFSKVYINLEDNKVTNHYWHNGSKGVIFYENIGQPYASDSTTGKEIYRKSLAEVHQLDVVNAYTQFMYGINHIDGVSKPLDYEALTLCLKKINYIFKGKHIGLPLIGCHLAGGIWDVNSPSVTFGMIKGINKDVKTIIQEELKEINVTIVHYKK